MTLTINVHAYTPNRVMPYARLVSKWLSESIHIVTHRERRTPPTDTYNDGCNAKGIEGVPVLQVTYKVDKDIPKIKSIGGKK